MRVKSPPPLNLLPPGEEILGIACGRKGRVDYSLSLDGRGKGEGEIPPPSNSFPLGEGAPALYGRSCGD